MTSANVVIYIIRKNGERVSQHRVNVMCNPHWEDLHRKFQPSSEYTIQPTGLDEHEAPWEGDETSLYEFLSQRKIKRRVPDSERLKKCLELAQKSEKEVGQTEWIFAKEIVLLDAIEARSKEVEVEVQAIQIGPAVFIAVPAEYFVEFGLEMKKRGNFKFTWPVELANDCVGYVPPRKPSGRMAAVTKRG